MSTDISMQTTNYQVGDRSWLLEEPTVKPDVTLDISKFTPAIHYPNGFIPSGTAIADPDGDGLYGPYDGSQTDADAQTCYGLTYSDVRAIRQNGSTASKVGTGAVVKGMVSAKKLPFQSGVGSVDAAAKTDLNTIRWEA